MTAAALLCTLIGLGGCRDGSSDNDPPAKLYALSATVIGLNASGLWVSVNSSVLWSAPLSVAQVLVPAGTSSELLTASLPSGAFYNVSITAQPPGETCTISNGRGEVLAANPANVVLGCVDHTYSVGGSISGLTASGLVLLDNGGDALTLSANATQFTMNTAVAYGRPYAITAPTAPTGLVCSVSNGTGIMAAADITSVRVACAPNFTLLYAFAGGSGDGANPYHNLIQASDGNFYGTTQSGGSSNGGTVFKLTASGSEALLYSFAEGASPFAAVTQGSDGNLYGTTAYGGTSGRGMVFKMTRDGAETTLYSFAGGSSDGANPFTGLVQGSDGNFYGTTYFGGSNNVGTVFKITPSGTETILHSFSTSSSDGKSPFDGLTQGSDGDFYGTTYYGGASNLGTVFKITPSGTETVLYSFAGGTADGEHPYGAVIEGSDGNFYGTTYQGGASGYGTVFKLTPSGNESVLYAFSGSSGDGAYPEAGLTSGSDGNLYGATYQGGTSNLGTIFKITPSGTETVLHSFAGGSGDGANDWANLVHGSDGKLYGSSYAGGASGFGTFFQVTLQ